MKKIKDLDASAVVVDVSLFVSQVFRSVVILFVLFFDLAQNLHLHFSHMKL